MIIGIDPGLSGAVAVLVPDGTLEALRDIPTLVLRTSRGTRQENNVPGLGGLLAPICGGRRTTGEPRRCWWRGMGGSA